MNRVQVSLQERSYDVLIGSNILSELNCLVQEVLSASQFFFVLDTNVEATHGKIAMGSFDCGTDHFALEAVESNKIAATIDSIWTSMLTKGAIGVLVSFQLAVDLPVMLVDSQLPHTFVGYL